MWKNWNPRILLVGVENGSLAVAQKLKYGVTIQPTSFTPRCIPKRNENV